MKNPQGQGPLIKCIEISVLVDDAFPKKEELLQQITQECRESLYTRKSTTCRIEKSTTGQSPPSAKHNLWTAVGRSTAEAQLRMLQQMPPRVSRRLPAYRTANAHTTILPAYRTAHTPHSGIPHCPYATLHTASVYTYTHCCPKTTVARRIPTTIPPPQPNPTAPPSWALAIFRPL